MAFRIFMASGTVLPLCELDPHAATQTAMNGSASARPGPKATWRRVLSLRAMWSFIGSDRYQEGWFQVSRLGASGVLSSFSGHSHLWWQLHCHKKRRMTLATPSKAGLYLWELVLGFGGPHHACETDDRFTIEVTDMSCTNVDDNVPALAFT
jgi:hypothetical protein